MAEERDVGDLDDSVEEMRALWRQLSPEAKRLVFDRARHLLDAREAEANAKEEAA